MKNNELYDEVKIFNERYCKRTKNELRVTRAYGGYKVVLTSKNGKEKKSILGTGEKSITWGYRPARDTLGDLFRADSKGELKYTIKSYEKKGG